MAKETNKLHNRLRMNFLKKIFILLSSLCLAAIPAKAQEDCPEYTTMGTDFWAAFVPNAVRIDNGTFNTGAVASFIVTGEQSATVTVSNPSLSWSQTYTHNGGTETYIPLPSHWDTTSAAPATMGYHITSTQPVFVVASNFYRDSRDVCNLLPSLACGSNYIVQDLSLADNPFAPAVVMVAKEDNTVITFTLPCAVRGLSQGAGSTVSVTLNAGQSYLLRSRSATTFCGMPVSANKPFALFQGHSCALVGAAGGRDLCMAQARSTEMWDTEFVATSTMNRVEGDYVLITSSANNCTVTINGAVAATLQSGQTHSFILPANTAARIITSQPAYVCLYPWSYNNGRTRGDPAAIPINPVNRWICHSQYPIHEQNNTYDENYINPNNHYTNIVTHANDTAAISLDGQVMTGWNTSTLPYCWKRIVTTPGVHTLHSTQGPFFAHAYGLGKWACYGYDVGVRTDSIPPDTVPVSSCDNHASEGNDFWAGFIVNGSQEAIVKLQLAVLGDTTCTFSASGLMGSVANNQQHTAGSASTIDVPTTYIPGNYSTTESKGIHITSMANVQALALFSRLASTDVTSLLPTRALGTRYIVLDYPADPGRSSITGATVTMVATQDNTTVTYTPPCPLYNSPSSAVGTPVTHTFTQAGQSLTLMANQGNASLSGMEITSDKPIALFQGNQITGVPHSTPSGDMIYDQSIPVHLWGKHHAVAATVGRSVGDVVRVAADSACTLTLSNGTTYAMADHGVQEFGLPANQALMIDSDKPVSVALITKGSDWNAEPGDASLLMVPPMERGICHGNFMCFSTQRINKWYVAVVTDSPSTMTLDGASIASQFSPIGTTGYSYARIRVMTQGAHGLDNSNGNFVAWTYGVGNVESYIYSIGQTWNRPETVVDICPDHTNKGRDFWLTMLPYDNEGSDLRIIMAADSASNITIEGPSGPSTLTLAAGSSVAQVVGSNSDIATLNTPFAGSFHVTSDHDIWVYANTDMTGPMKSGETATILPTYALDTTYIAQTYPPYTINNSVSFVATENNTVLRMVVPCPIRGTTIGAGTPLTVTLQRGQTYNLNSSSTTLGFDGMRVSSNGKPFAMFQGAPVTRVPVNAIDGGDLTYEQTLPVRDWGTEYIVPGFSYQGGNSYIRITAAENNTHITIDGNPVATALSACQSYEHVIPHTGSCHITSDNPVGVILYMTGYREAGNNGDPASVTIPPVDRGVCKTMFRADTYGGITNHYLTVICPTAINGSIQLDGAYLSTGATLCGNYTVYRLPITVGHHSLECSDGTFVAFVYEMGSWKAFAYPLGIALDTLQPEPPRPLIHDTILYSDTICQGQEYYLPAAFTVDGRTYTPPFEGLIHVRSTETAQPGSLERWSNWVSDDTVHHIHLTLNVLPSYNTTIQMSLIVGDTLAFADSVITLAGTYHFVFTAANGCDSVVTLNVMYENTRLSVDADGVCPGEAVTLTAEGTHTFIWRASPNDPELDSLQGQNPITVHPEQTTVYYLVDEAGNTIASVTVGVEPPPDICFESNREYLDFDHPVLMLHNCSSERYHTTWEFDDGVTMTGERARRLIYHPLPDTVTVVMTVCNRYDCCNDTTLKFPMKILSVWFPNIFFPDGETNNRFMCYTSHEVVEFELEVFNRWGFTVWHTDDINTPWDGTHNGEPVQQGAYVYRWFIKDIYGEHRTGIGTVTLVR